MQTSCHVLLVCSGSALLASHLLDIQLCQACTGLNMGAQPAEARSLLTHKPVSFLSLGRHLRSLGCGAQTTAATQLLHPRRGLRSGLSSHVHGLLQTCHKQVMSLAWGGCPPAEWLQVGLAACMRVPLLQGRLQFIKQLSRGDSDGLATEGRCWELSLCCLKHEVSTLLCPAEPRCDKAGGSVVLLVSAQGHLVHLQSTSCLALPALLCSCSLSASI